MFKVSRSIKDQIPAPFSPTQYAYRPRPFSVYVPSVARVYPLAVKTLLFLYSNNDLPSKPNVCKAKNPIDEAEI